MTVKEIKKSEEGNDGNVILHREGMFLRAYERSAMLFVENVAKFQLQRKYFKSIDSELVYLGFPAQNLKVLLEKSGVEREYDADNDTIVLCGFPSESNFEEWKSSIPNKETQKQKQKELMRENVDMTGMPDDLLHLYKSGFDLMVEIYKLTSSFTREYKFTVGERLKSDAFEMGLLCYRMALDGKRDSNEQVRCLIEKIRLRLRLLLSLGEISIKAFSRINIQMEYLYKCVI